MTWIISLPTLSRARTRFPHLPSVPAPQALGAGLAVGAGLVLLLQRRRRHHHTDEAIAAVSDHGPVTQATVPATPADTPIGPPGQNLEERLDEALQESFPSSDPVSIHIE
ncbi:MAG: hypothetical protein ACJ8B6_11220 [Gemmatimonadales bacterium]